MNESPTGDSVETTGASISPTSQEQQVTTAESQNQDAISHEQSQEAVSTDTATQTQTEQTNGGGQNDDDGLAKFAKSQGFDPENLTDGERRALKIAHDNQKAFRSSSDKKISDVASELTSPKENETEDEAFRREFKQFKYEQATNKFWSAEGRDKSLEPAMVEILNEKRDQYGADYARNLSQDLPTLYDLARLKTGNFDGTQVDPEAIRREERESIKRQSTASAGQPHAVTQTTETTGKIDRHWLETQYDPSNPEHRKMVDEAVANGDL